MYATDTATNQGGSTTVFSSWLTNHATRKGKTRARKANGFSRLVSHCTECEQRARRKKEKTHVASLPKTDMITEECFLCKRLTCDFYNGLLQARLFTRIRFPEFPKKRIYYNASSFGESIRVWCSVQRSLKVYSHLYDRLGWVAWQLTIPWQYFTLFYSLQL